MAERDGRPGCRPPPSRPTVTPAWVSADDLPGAVGLAAGGAVGFLLLTADGHRLLILAAIGAAGILIGARRGEAAGMAAVGVVPGGRGPGRLEFQRALGRFGVIAPVGLVQRVADRAAQQPAKQHAGGDTGRTSARGRADQRTKVKGMFVDPKQVQTVIERFPQVKRARLVIGREAEQDTMTLIIEATENGDGLASQVGAALKEITKLSGEVTVTPPGSLPNDGKVIADERHYE